MIHHTITFVAITTLQHAFVTFAMDIYRTDAAIWSQTETTADWQDHSTGTAYQQMAATETPESFTNMASTINNQLNVCLGDVVSEFNISNYVGKCSDLLHGILLPGLYYVPYDCKFPHELIRAAWKLYNKFNKLIKTALWFMCTGNTVVGRDVKTMSRIYVHIFTEFMDRINSSTAAIDEMAVLDTVADLYRTSIQQVESVLKVVKHLTGMISQEVKFYAMK